MFSKKSNRSSLPPSDMENSSAGNGDMTIIGYSYGRDSMIYKSKFPGKNITLKQFKSILTKKGNFRYFFKKVCNDFGTGVVFEEILDDDEILPLWEGKVLGLLEPMGDKNCKVN